MNPIIVFFLLMILSVIWGMVFALMLVEFRIKRGHLPKVIVKHKDQIIMLLNKEKGV